MQEMILVHSADIYHWGIKGQKWGTRRYQNPDGTYTEEGLARRRKQSDFAKDRAAVYRTVNKFNKTVNPIANKVSSTLAAIGTGAKVGILLGPAAGIASGAAVGAGNYAINLLKQKAASWALTKAENIATSKSEKYSSEVAKGRPDTKDKPTKLKINVPKGISEYETGPDGKRRFSKTGVENMRKAYDTVTNDLNTKNLSNFNRRSLEAQQKALKETLIGMNGIDPSKKKK